MTLTEFIKTHTPKRKITTKLLLRDLDEIEKNTFVAYVDEADESFDVKIKLDNKGSVVHYDCDCTQNIVCEHLLALANHLNNNKKEEKVVRSARKKKITEIDLLFDEQSPTDILDWTRIMLNTNKEWALNFKNHFSSKNIIVNEESIKNAIHECFVSVCGSRRKKIDTNEVKKIVDALDSSLKPYVEALQSTFSVENYILFQYLIKTLIDYHHTYNHNSSRLISFVEKLKNNYFNQLMNLKDETTWGKLINHIFDIIFSDKFYVEDLEFCYKIYNFCKDDALRNKFIFNKIEHHLIKTYEIIDKEYIEFNYLVEEFIFEIIKNNNAFAQHYKKFRPTRFQNEYNINLIDNLIQIKQYELAENYCKEQINGNYKEVYNHPYYKKLEDIYIKTNQTEALTHLYLKIGLFIYDFNIYLHLKAHLNKVDFYKFQIYVTDKVKEQAKYGNLDAFDYYFQLKKEQNKALDILELFKSISNLDLIYKYFETAISLNVDLFLNNLLNAPIYEYNNSEEKIILVSNKLIDLISELDIKKALKNFKGYYFNDIYMHLKEYFDNE